jgi:branched-chain amino acid transport system ATP-binding protein
VSVPALEARGLLKQFSALLVTDSVSFKIEPGARHALIGPKGDGKTTLINLLTGVLSPTEGHVLLQGSDATALSSDGRVRLGLSRTFQINQLFPRLTPVESLGLAISKRNRPGADFWRVAGTWPAIVAEIEELLARFGLEAEMGQPTRTLPYGKQLLLEIALALALATRPRVLLLDEPAAGVPEEERRDILAALAALPADVTILLIEHDMDLVFSFATCISVLVAGRILTEGDPDSIAADERVRAVYLGEDAHGAELLRVEKLSAGYGEARVFRASVSRSRTGGRSLSSGATASARRR